MKFTFETSYKNNKYEIKLTAGEGMSLQNAVEVITIGYNDSYISPDKQIENVIKTLLDNTRYTVKERQEAEIEANRFIAYLKNDIKGINPHIKQINISDDIVEIFEEENEKKKTDEELINEQ